MKIKTLNLAAALVVLAIPAANADQIRVIVNGEPVRFDSTGPIERDGRVLVPLRGVMEKLGAYVEWMPGSRMVVATRGETKIELPLGSRWAEVNGGRVRLDVAADSYLGRTMVPLRFLSESLGADVQWSAATSTVSIERTGGGLAHRDQSYTPGDRRERRENRREIDRRMPEVLSVTSSFQGGTIRPGDTINVTMRATAGGKGYFRIRGVVGESTMTEVTPGVYEGQWTYRGEANALASEADILAFVLVGDRATAERHP